MLKHVSSYRHLATSNAWVRHGDKIESSCGKGNQVAKFSLGFGDVIIFPSVEISFLTVI